MKNNNMNNNILRIDQQEKKIQVNKQEEVVYIKIYTNLTNEKAQILKENKKLSGIYL
jgi:hypothetical protein